MIKRFAVGLIAAIAFASVCATVTAQTPPAASIPSTAASVVLPTESGQKVVASTAPQSFSTTVTWGDWVAAFLSHIQTIAVSAAGVGLTYLAAKLPATIRPVASALVQEQTLNRAIDYGFAAVKGAVKGKTLNLETSNAVLAHAEAYATTVAPNLAKGLGDLLLPKLIARLSPHLDADVTAASLSTSRVLPTVA